MTSTTKNPVPAAYRNQIPHFKHDCDCCHFLGNYKDADTNEAMDLYVHTSGQCPTVIARIGSDGPDYMSGLGFSYGSIEPLVQARMRAQAAGLLKYNLNEALHHASPGFIESYEELQAAIPSTREYQAYRAFVSGDVAKSRALVNALVNEAFEDEKQYKEGAIRMACSFKVTNRLDKMLQVMCGMNPLASMQAADAVTEFVWKNARPSSLLPTPRM